MELDVDGRIFVFASSWRASKYDEWSYYKNQFGSTRAKAVDIVALDGKGDLFLIEVKDYTHPDTSHVPLDQLPTTVAEKCRDTLGGLAAGRIHATGEERALAQDAMQVGRIRIVLHIELASKGGRLHNPAQVRANLRTKLRSVVKSIDPHASVESHDSGRGTWSSRRSVQT
jgi:hypothetical protein